MSNPPPKKVAPVSEGNPAFNMMGLPKIHTWRLPSRNWCIFWATLGSFAGGIAYDRYQKKQVIARYKGQVAYLADAPLKPLEMPRKLNIYMGAPPGDTIHVAREHFVEYVKPVLNAAAIDFEIIEGRMQGDIRHKVAQGIRDKKLGKDNLTDLQRATKERLIYDAQAGDIVIGRHTYKEYLKGFHEGYLGPLEEPEAITSIMNPYMPGDPITEAPALDESASELEADTPPPTPVEKTDEEIKAEIDAIKAKIPSSPPSYILPTEYAATALNSDPTVTNFSYVPMQHLLGFLNTPWRIYRFLNRRSLAEEMCRATTAAVLASQTRAFAESLDVEVGVEEQMDWPKKNRQKPDGVWVESIALDKRVIEALRVYQYEEPTTFADVQ